LNLDQTPPKALKLYDLNAAGSGLKGSLGFYTRQGKRTSLGDAPLLQASTYMELQCCEQTTFAPIRASVWHPMLTVDRPENVLQCAGWSLANLTSIRIDDIRNTSPPLTFWKFISKITSLQRIGISACHVLELIPFLFNAHDPSAGSGKAVGVPLHLLYLDILGTPSPDTGSEILLEPIVETLQKRRQAALEREVPNIAALKSLLLMSCKVPPSETVLASIPSTLIKRVHWEVQSLPVQSQ
jgi:hypothetical protein